MAFGRRAKREDAKAPLPPAGTGARVEVQLTSEERHAALRDFFLRVLAGAGQVAEAVRSNGSLVLRGIADESDPDEAPIHIKDLKEHFAFTEQGVALNPFFGYVMPDRPDHIDPAAQFDLHALVMRIRELNVFCQEGDRDGALGVALQAPRLPVLIDRIIAGAGFFAAYFDNMIATHPFIARTAPAGRIPPDFAVQRIGLERHKLMASDQMLAPERLEELLPNRSWPHMGVEIARRQGSGQLVHGIYFPQEYAEQLARRTEQAMQAA